MAENKFSLEVEVGGVGQSINSVKELKQALKDARDAQLAAASAFGEGSKEFIEASKNVSKLKDKVEDLNDSTQSLKGSGVERASQGFNQLGEGLRNLDLDKVKVGLTAVKSALAATGILLLVQGVKYLFENFDELSKGSGLLAKALRFVGDIITSVKDAIYEFTDAIGLSNSALDKQGDAIKTNADKATEALGKQTAEYDRQIAIAKASGQSAVKLEKAKQQAIIDTNKALVEQTIAYVRNGGQLDEEKKKLLTGQLEAIKNAVNQQQVIEITANKASVDNYKKSLDDKNKAEQDAWELTLKIRGENSDAQKLNEARERQEKLDADKAASDEFNQYAQETSEQETNNSIDQADFKRKLRQAELEEFKQNEDQKMQAVQAALNSTQQLTDLYFSYQLNKNKGNAKAEQEIRKKQFNVNKAFGIANSVIDGIGGIAKALNNPYPLNIILAVAAGIAATANTIKIASTKFDAGSADSGGGSSAPSIPIPAPPTINTPQANTNSNTSFDNTGKRTSGEGERAINPTQNINVNIGVDEVTKKQNRVNVLEQKSTF